MKERVVGREAVEVVPERNAGRMARLIRSVRTGWMVLLVLAALVPVAGAGCGGEEVDDTMILTVEQALAAEPGQAMRVRGMLVATENEVKLASALLESYPPQAGGSTLVVEDLDMQALVGLSSTAGQSGMALVTWSDFPVVLGGTVEDGVLGVKAIPPVFEAASAEIRVRFSPGGEALPAGDPVWWVFDVTNLTAGPLDLTFLSGQMGEVTFRKDGTEVYRWSDGKSFTQAVMVETLQPGQSRAVILNDLVSLAPGTYEVTAKVTASSGPEGSTEALPEVAATLTVR